MKFGSPEFKKLQRAWYQRLEEEGFQDAEEIIAGELVLKQNAAHPYRGVDALQITTKEAYYRLLGNKIHSEEFSNDIDKLILTMFAEGKKIKVICQALFERGTERGRATVRYTIRKYEMQWGLREYSPLQLNKKPPPTPWEVFWKWAGRNSKRPKRKKAKKPPPLSRFFLKGAS